MNDKQQRPTEVGKTDREGARTKDNPIGIDDIGLPSGIAPEEVRRFDEIKPDPEKQENKRT